MAILNQAFALITSLQGSAIYHIILFFALQAAFGIALSHRRRYGPSSNSTRLVIAAGLAALARGLLLVLVALGASGLFSAEALLPPLDRAVSLFCILMISWAVMFRPGRRWADVIVSLAVVGVVVLYAALAIQWYPAGASGVQYNPYDTIWELAKVGVILFSLLGLLIFRPADWGTGLGLFLLLLAGVLYHLLSPILTDSYPASERMAEMAAFPLFAVIVYRHALGSLPAPQTVVVAAPAVSQPVAQVTEADLTTQNFKVKLTPQAASALAYIAVGSDDSDFSKRVSEAVGRTLLADYTLFFAPPIGEEALTCVNAFDLIREIYLPGFTISARKIPTIASAIARSRPARLRWDTPAQVQEVASLAESLGIPQYGPALFVPFAEEGSDQNLGGILVMAAFSQKEWTNEDHNLLAGIAKPLAKAIASFNTKSKSTYDLLNELDKAHQWIDAAQNDAQDARQRIISLTSDLEHSRDEARQQLIQIESLSAIIQAEAHQSPTINQTDNDALSGSEDLSDSEELTELRGNYRRSLEEMAALNEQLAEAQAALKEHQQAAGKAIETTAAAVTTASTGDLATDTNLVESLTTEVAAKQTALDQLKREMAALHDNHAEEIAAFTDRLTTAQATVERYRQQQPGTQPLQNTAGALQVQLADAQAEIEKLKTALASLSALPASEASDETTTADLTRQLTEAHSEIVNLRHQLQAAPTDAPSVLRSQSAMLLSLIQDMRQPLSSMVGYTDLLLGESVGIIGALQRNFLERVKASGERMTHTLDDLVRITAIDSGTLMLEEQDFEIADVIEDAFTGVGTQFREKGISLRMDIADDLPPVAADRDAILQIVSRLLNNACVASAPNSQVILTAQPQADSAMIVSVQDTGGGIAEKDLSKVFARSYRADRPLIEGLGETGVGLSVAKALAEAQGGRIWVESQNGSGSTFSVLLPTNGHQ
jgi:signal transduction histidine kinase